jgi:hypothetical protein
MNENEKKKIIHMINRENKLCNIGIIQYIFRNGPVNIRDLLRPHGHSNEDGNLLSRTYQSTKDKAKIDDLKNLLFKKINTINSSIHYLSCFPKYAVILFNNQH